MERKPHLLNDAVYTHVVFSQKWNNTIISASILIKLWSSPFTQIQTEAIGMEALPLYSIAFILYSLLLCHVFCTINKINDNYCCCCWCVNMTKNHVIFDTQTTTKKKSTVKNCEHTKFHVFHYTTTFTFLLYNGINILNWYRIRYLLLGFFCLSLLFFFFFTGKNSSFAPSLFAVFFFFWNLTDFHSKATSLNLRDALHQFRLTCEVNMTFSWDFQKMKNEKRKKCKPNCLRSNAHHMFPEWMQTSTFFIKNTHNVWFIRQI